MSAFLGLIGKRFGRLTVLRKTKRRQCGSVVWRCLCVCGKIKDINGASLRYNRTLSCGCLMMEKGRENAKAEAARNKVWGSYKASAKARSLPFSLSPEHFDELIVGSCFYCGEGPKYESVAFSGNVFVYNGIDRLDSSAGYFKENCVPCCRICNIMKRAIPLCDFIGLIRKIAKHTEAMSCTA
jgi:hypothetical protein